MSRRKLSIDYVRSVFQEAGCTLISGYQDSKSDLTYRCKCGKINVTNFNNFSRGYRCKNCYLAQFAKSKAEKDRRQKLRQQLFTISDVARMLNVRIEDLWAEVRLHKTLPAPIHGMPGRRRRYYNAAEVKKIISMIQVV